MSNRNLEELLRTVYPQAFGLTRTNIKLHIVTYKKDANGVFDIKDGLSCSSKCRLSGTCDDKRIAIFKQSSNATIEIVEFEEYIKQFDGTNAGTKGGVCDYILVSTEVFIMHEQTCSKKDYIEPYTGSKGEPKQGKRREALSQLKTSINRLMNIPEFSKFASGKSLIGLFAYRVNDSIKGDVQTQSTALFNRMNNLICDNIKVVLPHGFSFEECIYPQIFLL